MHVKDGGPLAAVRACVCVCVCVEDGRSITRCVCGRWWPDFQLALGDEKDTPLTALCGN